MPGSARNSLFYVILRVGTGIVLSSAAMLVVPRFISPREMGLAAFALSIHAFFVITCESGFRLYAIRTDLDQQPSLPGHLLINQTAHVAVSLLVLGAIWCLGRFFSPAVWTQSLPLAFLMLLFQPLYFRRQLATAPFERRLDFKSVGRVEILENVFYNTALLILAWRSFGAWSFALAHAVRCVLGYVQAQSFPMVLQPLKGRKWLAPEILEAYKYGYSLQAIQWVHGLRCMLTNSMIINFAGAPALGLYDRSLVVGNAPLGFMQGVTDRFLFAYVSKHHKDDPARCKEVINRCIRFMAWMDKLLYLAVLFVGLPLLLHFWGAKWNNIAPLVPIVVLGVGVFGSISFPIGPLLTSTGHTRFIFKTALASLAITLTAGPALILFFGAAGACWLGVMLWAMTVVWFPQVERIVGSINWFQSWILSSLSAVGLYLLIKCLVGSF